jgi:hypothetical protein
MSKRKNVRAQRQLPLDENDLPIWNAAEGNLDWRGQRVLHLAGHAHAERAVLDKFEKFNWRFVVWNPLPRDKADVGDPTTTRRNAVHNLMKHQGNRPLLQFFSVLDGFVAWCPVDWLSE